MTQLRFDFAFTLAFDADVFLRIETEFMTTCADGATETFDPEPDLTRMSSLLSLHQVDVAAAKTDEIGNLRLDFTDGRVLEVRPDQDYEAWNLSGKHGLLSVCLPGGGLAVWSATADSTGPATPSSACRSAAIHALDTGDARDGLAAINRCCRE